MQDFKEIPAHQNFSAAKGEEKYTCIGKLRENVTDFRRGHLATVIMIEIAMQAILIAAVRNIKMDAERDPQFHSLLMHLFEKAHRLSGHGEESVRG